jgi:hypothetical protein
LIKDLVCCTSGGSLSVGVRISMQWPQSLQSDVRAI